MSFVGSNRLLHAVVSLTCSMLVPVSYAAVTSDGDASFPYDHTIGNGSLTIDGGSTFTASGTGYVGTLDDGSATVSVTGAGSTWKQNGDLFIGYRGTGVMNVDSGGTISTGGYSYTGYGYIGYWSTGVGTVNISGEGSKWAPTKDLDVGYFGTGALNLSQGATVKSIKGYIGSRVGGDGTVRISGAGSKWETTDSFYVGAEGTGRLTLEAGGQLVSGWSSYLGQSAGASGTATVTGAGSQWKTRGALYVGELGSGSLTVSDGGVVEADSLLASFSDLYGNGTINALKGAVLDADLVFDATQGRTKTFTFGTGGQLNLTVANDGILGAGYKNNGSLRIADGQQISCSSGYLGYSAGSTGTGLVSGVGSQWQGTLYVGHSGTGSLTVENGGQLLGNVHLGYMRESAYGTLLVKDEGTLVSGPAVYVNNGAMTVTQGGKVQSTYGSVTNGVLRITGAGSQWTLSENMVWGDNTYGSGTGIIEQGGQLHSQGAYLLAPVGSHTSITVTGAGSQWNVGQNLYVGTNASSEIAPGSTRVIVANGGTLNVGTLFASLNDLQGDGTINARGAILDGHLMLNSPTALKQTFAFGTGGTFNLDIDTTSSLGVGYKQAGSLQISDGVQIASANGYLGYLAGSTGSAVISGQGTRWDNAGYLSVGKEGGGSLVIEKGAQVTSKYGYLSQGFNAPAATAIITGQGSKWTASDQFYMGPWGNSRASSLTLSDGGQVQTNGTFLVNGSATLNLHLSDQNPMITAGTFRSNSNSFIFMYADAFLAAGSYQPIAATDWNASGYYTMMGGSWNSSTHRLTVTAATDVAAGAAVNVANASQRLIVSDEATSQRMGMSFTGVAFSRSMTASLLDQSQLDSFASLVDPDQTVLSAWQFATTLSFTQAMLSFDIGTDWRDIHLWQRNAAGTWSLFTPTLFTYDANGIAHFTTTSLNGMAYALTAAVPEPATLSLLLLAAMPLLRRRHS